VFYRSKRGKEHKAKQNRKRYLISHIVTIESKSKEDENARGAEKAKSDSVVGYIRTLIYLIDGFWASIEEVYQMLKRIWRQRSLCRIRKLDYIVEKLNKDPP